MTEARAQAKRAAMSEPDPRSARAVDRLNPRFDAHGLITAVATDRTTGAVLMIAHMDAEALRLTIDTREAWFWSRSRARLWRKGESSGNILSVAEIRIDCDQDAVWLIVDPKGPACHTGRQSCFFRRVEDGRLSETG